MKLCSKCRKNPWPYAIVLLIASFAGFLTWLTLSAAGASPTVNSWLSAIAFLAVAGLLFTYMVHCMARHCRDDARRSGTSPHQAH
ncbi:MAG TPA: hypothetical protein ENK05_05240 [Gammaproteobacteria bacterium]|nr:hypothetical protein [Gammaproteobacteria bacterium]